MNKSEMGDGSSASVRAGEVRNVEATRQRRRINRTGVGLVLAAGIYLAGGAAGYSLGVESRNDDIATLTDLQTTQDWLLDRNFTSVVADSGVTEQDGTIYVQLEDPEHCEKPLSFEFTGDALVWDQKDQAGNIIDRVEIQDATYATNVLADVCPQP